MLTNQCSMQHLGGAHIILTHVAMAGRGILSPTGQPKSVGRRLFSAPTTSRDMARKQIWSREGDRTLVEFVLFHSDPAVWPSPAKVANLDGYSYICTTEKQSFCSAEW